MSYNAAGCVGSNYDVLYSNNTFTTGNIASDLNYHASQNGINPATLATITSMETESVGLSSNCSSCDPSGVGVCQVGEAMFNDYNSAYGGTLTWCSGMCGSNYGWNLELTANFLFKAFGAAEKIGITDSIQMMAMAATTWNGHW
ncbi:MAG: hypothetical protein ACYCVB_12430 [Bacilli bacterium]